jgi:hypothetical protein
VHLLELAGAANSMAAANGHQLAASCAAEACPCQWQEEVAAAGGGGGGPPAGG